MIKYILIAAGIIVLLLGLQVKLLTDKNAKLLQNEGIYKAQMQELAGALVYKDHVIGLCNERTRELREEADKKAKAVEKARSEAREAAKKNRELADELLKFKRKDGETACSAAERLFNEYLDKRGQP